MGGRKDTFAVRQEGGCRAFPPDSSRSRGRRRFFGRQTRFSSCYTSREPLDFLRRRCRHASGSEHQGLPEQRPETHHDARRLEADNPLPEAIRDMPDQVVGRFVDLDPARRQDIESAMKRVVIFNDTQVLYTFTFDSQTSSFSARKR